MVMVMVMETERQHLPLYALCKGHTHTQKRDACISDLCGTNTRSFVSWGLHIQFPI